MSDRLAELRRQRALVQEQLNWLDAEIGAAEKRSPASPLVAALPKSVPPPPPPASTVTPAAGVSTLPAASAIDPVADAMLEEYKVAPEALRTDVRKGCLLYLVAAFALVIAGVAILYFALRH